MDPRSPPNPNPTALAKGALRRLAQSQLEPTPENYARAYADESGQPQGPAPAVAPPASNLPDAKVQGAAWASLVERLARNLERGGRQWTAGRRKESLRRVLDGSRSDAQRLLQRLQSLMSAWEADQPSDTTETGIEDPPVDASAVLVGSQTPAPPVDAGQWPPLVGHLQATVQAGLAPEEARAAELATELGRLADAVAVWKRPVCSPSSPTSRSMSWSNCLSASRAAALSTRTLRWRARVSASIWLAACTPRTLSPSSSRACSPAHWPLAQLSSSASSLRPALSSRHRPARPSTSLCRCANSRRA